MGCHSTSNGGHGVGHATSGTHHAKLKNQSILGEHLTPHLCCCRAKPGRAQADEVLQLLVDAAAASSAADTRRRVDALLDELQDIDRLQFDEQLLQGGPWRVRAPPCQVSPTQSVVEDGGTHTYPDMLHAPKHNPHPHQPTPHEHTRPGVALPAAFKATFGAV